MICAAKNLSHSSLETSPGPCWQLLNQAHHFVQGLLDGHRPASVGSYCRPLCRSGIEFDMGVLQSLVNGRSKTMGYQVEKNSYEYLTGSDALRPSGSKAWFQDEHLFQPTRS